VLKTGCSQVRGGGKEGLCCCGQLREEKLHQPDPPVGHVHGGLDTSGLASRGLCVVGVRDCLGARFIRWASMGMWDPCLGSADLDFSSPCTSRHWLSTKPAPFGETPQEFHKVSGGEATITRVKKPFCR